jgi:UDP-glucose 4-epimerase
VAQLPQDNAVLVTGAGGRLGRLLRRAAARDGTGSVPFTFQSRRPGCDLTWAPGDPEQRLPRCGMVVALWGRTAGSADALAENAALVATSQSVAAACGARKLVHLSSAAVYGPGRAMTEQTTPHPTSDYAQAKRAMELAAARTPPGGGVAQCCLRLANVMGADSLAPSLRGTGPVALDRFADGRGPLRSYIAASDLLQVLCRLAALPHDALPPLLNVAAPAPIGMDALARAAGRPIAWRPAPETAVPVVTLDTGRLTGLLPGMDFRRSAEHLVADWRSLEAMA